MKLTTQNASVVVSLVLFGAITFGFLPKAGAGEELKSSPEWSKKMRELGKTLADLLTDVSSDKRFNDPTNKVRIEKNAKSLSTLAHDLNKSGKISPDADPTIQILTGMFADESNRAYVELKRGNRTYARNVLKSVSGYCIACHTRNSTGPQFAQLPFEPTSSDMKTLEKGEFFAASRQFDRADVEFKKVIDGGVSSLDQSLEWERAVRYSLAIAIRVKEDPALALKLVDSALGSKNIPFFIRQNAAEWRRSILKWQAEPPHHETNEEGLHAEAVRLIAEARNIQKYPVDRSGDIFYLRASAVIHSLLQVSPKGRYAADAYLLAGLCYEVLGPFNLFDLHDFYYEACIRQSPNSKASELCYERYQESVVLGYTGSGGTSIPDELKDKLKSLELMAHPNPDQLIKNIQ